MIFNIQKCSNRDGDGLRTTVFFKGCPLSCKWCANPESQSFHPEIMESNNKCIGCMRCLKECPVQAIHLEDDFPRILREKCTKCFHCTEICYAGAKYVVGWEPDIESFFREIEKERAFFKNSGGGATFSGGEPLSQPVLLKNIAQRCHEEGIHVMLESCGYANYSQFEGALPFVDALYMDLKHIDPAVHKALTGVDNALILQNIQKISDFGIPIIIRTPVIPGYNDDDDNIIGIAEFIRSIANVKDYELLAYHKLGEVKYRALGRLYPLPGITPPAPAEMHRKAALANRVLSGSGKTCFYIE